MCQLCLPATCLQPSVCVRTYVGFPAVETKSNVARIIVCSRTDASRQSSIIPRPAKADVSPLNCTVLLPDSVKVLRSKRLSSLEAP